jgi:hypothetical protein
VSRLCFSATYMKMNPMDPASFNHRTEQLSTERTYHFVDQQPVSYPDNKSAAATRTILCVHGFPDIWWVSLSLAWKWSPDLC